MDGDIGKLLVHWVRTAITDIVGYFSINPQTLYGSIQEGPHLQAYPGLDKMDYKQIDAFIALYKVFAVHVFEVMHRRLSEYADEALHLGYLDISASVEDYRIGMLVIRIDGTERHRYDNTRRHRSDRINYRDRD